MKKLVSILAATLIVSTVFLSEGCKKYPDGPSVSLLSKKARIAGDWTLKTWTDASGVSVPLTGTTWTMKIDRGGTYTSTTTFGTTTFSDAGTWTFGTGKTTVTFLSTTGGGSTIYIINELRNKALTLNDTGDILHFEQ